MGLIGGKEGQPYGDWREGVLNRSLLFALLVTFAIDFSFSQTTDELARCVVFLKSNRPDGTFGSGFLVQSNETPILDTAAHVARDMTEDCTMILQGADRKEMSMRVVRDRSVGKDGHYNVINPAGRPMTDSIGPHRASLQRQDSQLCKGLENALREQFAGKRTKVSDTLMCLDMEFPAT